MKSKLQVMKFGGTSVGDASCIARAAQIVARAARENGVVAVVSAMTGVTNRLVEAAARAGSGDAQAGVALIEALRRQHHDALAALVPAGDVRSEVVRRIGETLAEGQRLFDGTALLREVTPRALDAISSLGERLCAPIFASAVGELGVRSVAIDAVELIITDSYHGGAEPLMDVTHERCEARLRPLLKENAVPIATGFIGATRQGTLTTLGRGGSDYSATILGAALGADEVIIWTDVDGVLTADPRLVPDARTIPEISYREAAELAYFGAKVLHPKTIQPAMDRGIRVRICNSLAPEEPGTVVAAETDRSDGTVKAIAHKTGITVLQVVSGRMFGAYGFLRALFEVFDRHRAVVDVVTTSEVSVSLTLEHVRSLPEIVSELRSLGDVSVEPQRAIVCVVGEGLRTTPGIAARIFTTVRDINVSLISQGASRVNLTFVIAEDRVRDAVCRLHETFFEREPAQVGAPVRPGG